MNDPSEPMHVIEQFVFFVLENKPLVKPEQDFSVSFHVSYCHCISLPDSGKRGVGDGSSILAVTVILVPAGKSSA